MTTKEGEPMTTDIELPEDKRAAWGDGPWADEPDRIEFEAHGLPCLMQRVAPSGAWCGYVAVSPGHPLHGAGYDSANTRDVFVHGGLTYASACRDTICHVPKQGEPDDVWWFGFDCAHCDDFMPGLAALLKLQRQDIFGGDAVYRDANYVRDQCVDLALQLRAFKP